MGGFESHLLRRTIALLFYALPAYIGIAAALPARDRDPCTPSPWDSVPTLTGEFLTFPRLMVNSS